MMRRFTLAGLFFSLILLITTRSQAQAKIAYVNMQQLIMAMPEAKQAYDSLQRYEKSLNADGQVLLNEFQKRMEEYNKNEKTMTDNIRDIKRKELSAAQDRLEEYRARVEQQLSTREQALSAPIIARAKKAVTEIANEKGYAAVLDSSKDILVAANCDDLLAPAKQKLGIK